MLGSNDFDGETAERYGYVNRALPDNELDGFVDALARRIASFDRRPIAAAKNDAPIRQQRQRLLNSEDDALDTLEEMNSVRNRERIDRDVHPDDLDKVQHE